MVTWLAAWRAFVSANRKVLKQFGVTPREYAALIEIRCSDEPYGPTIGDVAAALHIGHNTMVQLVNILCQKGYAERSRYDVDRRKAHVTLTTHGRAILNNLVRVHHHEFRSVEPELIRVE